MFRMHSINRAQVMCGLRRPGPLNDLTQLRAVKSSADRCHQKWELPEAT